MEEHPFSKIPKKLNNYIRYSGMAFQMLAVILAGTLGGRRLDRMLEFEFPVFTVSLSFISVLIAIYLVLKDVLPKK